MVGVIWYAWDDVVGTEPSDRSKVQETLDWLRTVPGVQMTSSIIEATFQLAEVPKLPSLNAPITVDPT